MTVFTRRPALRWIVPVVLALVLAGGGTAIGALTAVARGGLPPRTAAQLLVDVQQARVKGLSGTVVQTADLGIPSLPGAGSNSSDLTSLISGSHTLRLWYAGPNRARVAVQGQLGESDVVRNGTDLWTWASSDRTATHRKVPLAKKDTGTRTMTPGATPMTPQQAADEALKAISPTTRVSTDGTATVAGRPAYELVLSPRTSATLVDSVHIAIDGSTHVPLRVQVFARSMSKPALEVGFTSFDPTTPGASVFAFNPPPGTTVTQSSGTSPAKLRVPGTHQASSEPKVVGSGWSTVIVTTVPTGATAATAGRNPLTQLVDRLPKVSGRWGSGRLLRGTLFSALLTDDGRLAVGAVPARALTRALGSR
jgi:outer membrane lipoprotein-sorting protein